VDKSHERCHHGAATMGLPVTIVQSTRDEGKGILYHVKSDLGAHHAPDVFFMSSMKLLKGPAPF